MMNEKRGEQGFTLVELMITVVVISLAVLGAMGANISIQQSANSNFDRAVATQDAHEVLEAMRDATNDQPTLSFQGAAVTAGNTAAAAVGSLPAAYGETIAVAVADAAANPLDVTVTVTWQDRGLGGGDATRALALRTFITKRNSA